MSRPPQHPNQDVIDAVHSVGRQVHGVSQQLTSLQPGVLLLAIQNLSQQVSALQSTLLQEIRTMSDTLDAEIQTLTNNVSQLTTVDQSAVALLNGLSQQLSAAIAAAASGGATDAQLQQLNSLNSSLASQTGDLAAAVTANTPAAPANPPAGP